MRIALVLEHFDRASGGQAIWTQGFAAHLCEAGHEVHVVSCDFGRHELPVRTHPVAWAWLPLTRAQRFAAALEALRPDAVHDSGAACWLGVFQPQTGSNLYSLDREIGTEPPRRRLRAALSPKMRLLRRQMARLERRQAERARRIVAVSGLVRDLIAARHPEAAGKIVVAPNGVDTAFFAPEAAAGLRREARTRLGAGDETLFLAAAHNFRLKGLDTALAALANLAQAGHRLRLAVAGGAVEPAWLRLAAELGVGERVVFCGQIADMRPLFAAADVFVHPTRWDACSLVVLEALASGLPVITTRANGAAEAIAHGQNGFVMDPNDASALADHMRSLLDPELRGRFGAAARQAALGRDIRENYRAVARILLDSARP